MSTHNIRFYEEISKNYHLIIIKYHQIRTLFLLLKYSEIFRDESQPVLSYFDHTDLLCDMVCFIHLPVFLYGIPAAGYFIMYSK